MLRTALVAAVAACVLAVASIDAVQPASAAEIIVLVHGLAGWGESELGTFRYVHHGGMAHAPPTIITN